MVVSRRRVPHRRVLAGLFFAMLALTATSSAPVWAAAAPPLRQQIVEPRPDGPGYVLTDADLGLFAFGDVGYFGGLPIVHGDISAIDSIRSAPPSFWRLTDVGEVLVMGGPGYFHGDMTTAVVTQITRGEAVALIPLPDDTGYRIVFALGDVLGFNAPALGTAFGLDLAAPIVDAAPTPSGDGYLLAAADGGVFAFGDAVFAGSLPQLLGGATPDAPVVAIVPDLDGVGYWLIAADGGVFSFDAPFLGSVPAALGPGRELSAPIVDADRYGSGYVMAGADGGVFVFGDGEWFGSVPSVLPGDVQLPSPIVGIAAFDDPSVSSSGR